MERRGNEKEKAGGKKRKLQVTAGKVGLNQVTVAGTAASKL